MNIIFFVYNIPLSFNSVTKNHDVNQFVNNIFYDLYCFTTEVEIIYKTSNCEFSNKQYMH